MGTETWAAVDHYFADLLLPPDLALQAALRDSAAAGLPPQAVWPAQGKLLHLLARMQGARNILEIGTLGGYSAIWLARALPPGGRLVTLECDPRYAEVARANIARAGLSGVFVEVWLGLPYPIWVSYLRRYFTPLSREVNLPNPYNKGTDLEKVPLRQTSLNGMRSAYVELLQEYMMVSLSQFTRRVFYNKDLFRKLTGKDAPTNEYRQFLADCLG